MAYFTIHLLRVDIVRPAGIVRQMVIDAFASLAATAGHELNVVEIGTGRQEQTVPDVSLDFTRDLRGLGPNDRVLAEQSGGILVGAILNMRVGGNRSRGTSSGPDLSSPLDRRERSAWTTHTESAELLWSNGELPFARTVGNIAVHELGHTIGGLPHHPLPENYMFTGARIDREFGRDWRSRTNLRWLWSRERSWVPIQRQRLTEALRARELRGFEVTALRVAP